MTDSQATGKLPAGTLARLLGRYARGSDPAVLVGPGIGLDAAAVAVKDSTLVLASDPVTYATDQIGHYAVHVNANDIFVSGAEPRWFLADILLPPGKGRMAESIFAQIDRACSELGVTLLGGHTEMTPDLPRPMVAGFMIGQVRQPGLITAGGVRPGDVLILTKGVAIEGTAAIAKQREAELLKHLPRAVVRRAKRLLHTPGLSVGPEARLARRFDVHAMHDPTEGGLLNGLLEMALASKLALHVDTSQVPVYPQTERVCRHFGIDPLKLLASGALLISCRRGAAEDLLETMASEGIPASRIGSAGKGAVGLHLQDGRMLKRAIPDQILKIFAADGPD